MHPDPAMEETEVPPIDEAAAAPEDQQQISTLLSLFPVSNTTTVATTSPQWLRNSSFTTDLSVVSDAVSSSFNLQTIEEEVDDDEDKKVEPNLTSISNSYKLLESSGSDKDERDYSDNQRKKKKNKKKKRKRERDDEDYNITPYAFGTRKSSVRAWTNSETKPSKDYYFDSRGDPDNLAFGSLYRMDIVKYKLDDAVKSGVIHPQVYSRLSNRCLLMRGELDVDGLDGRLKSSGRYWSAKYSVIERHRSIKRIRVFAPKNHVQVTLDDFIPLLDEDENDHNLSGTSVVEESWEDEILRKTRDFNKMTREQPHNVRIWLDFAKFQDKVASMQPKKGARLQTLEKKISILEKANELNPEDEDLLLYLLKAYQGRDSVDVVIGRWEKMLMQHSGSYKLWREFLRFVQGEFTTFKVSELRRMYVHAIQALSAASSSRLRQARPAVELPTLDAADVELELGIVDIFLSLCRFEWQAGYHELATALFQAEMEYSLFCPPLQLTEQSKKRLFDHFWTSSGMRIGEDGALGWSTWLEKDEENRQKLQQEMLLKEVKQGGWTGWFVPPSKDKENLTNLENDDITDVALEDMEEQIEDQDVRLEEDDHALLRMLGIDVDAEASREVHETRTWVRWSEEELSRDRDQWMPVHLISGISHSKENIEEADEQLSRVILFEDVSEYIFSLSTSEARLSLVLQFIDFFGGPTSQCICTNSSSWSEKVLSLDSLPDSILQHLKRVHSCHFESTSSFPSLENLLHCPDSLTRMEKMKFLRNATLLCLKVFPRDYKIEEATLIAEEQSVGNINKPKLPTMPSQALAKRLLKSDRQDVLLCGVYARREAAFGNFEHARKVFDMALSSINGLPLETKSISAPILTFWYSEMELADGSGIESESKLRAIHILSCLGSGIPYSPYEERPSSTQLLRAHQGFKDRIYTLSSLLTRRAIDDSYIALVCSAALFEELTTGWVEAVKLLSDVFSMVLPERKSQSYQLELLFNFHVRMLQRHHHEAKPSQLLQFVSVGLHTYPCSPELFSSLVLLSHLYIVPNNLRRIFDELNQKKPSVVLYLFSLSYELSRGASPHRIHGLFERALTNDKLNSSVVLWRCYIAYEIDRGNLSAARKIFFRAIHACPWSKLLWLDGFQKLNNVLSAKELFDLQEVMRDKELNLRTDIYEILLQDELNPV